MIEAIGRSKRYGDTLAVDDLSFTVPPGQVTGFLGPNGAGKSTTMRLILGLDTPTSGTVTVNGRPYTSLRRPLFQVGALLEAKAVHGGRSAFNHLLALALSNGIPKARFGMGLGPVCLRGGEGGFVQARPPEAEALAVLLRARGATVTRQGPDLLRITGTDAVTVGEVARAEGLALQELSTQQATLEQRYMQLTGDSVD